VWPSALGAARGERRALLHRAIELECAVGIAPGADHALGELGDREPGLGRVGWWAVRDQLRGRRRDHLGRVLRADQRSAVADPALRRRPAMALEVDPQLAGGLVVA